jgi:hypothetical protein
LDGSLKDASFYTDTHFGFEVPTDVAGVETALLHPRQTWADKQAFDAQAAKLANMFTKNSRSSKPMSMVRCERPRRNSAQPPSKIGRSLLARKRVRGQVRARFCINGTHSPVVPFASDVSALRSRG